MILLLLTFLFKNRLILIKNKLTYFFIILEAMLISCSASPQVIADFTTFSVNTGSGSLVFYFVDYSFTNNSIVNWQWDFGDRITSNL
mgnify:CR=1|jgi:PKD repeat protein